MTITTEINPTISYSGNGSTTAFAIPYVFYTKDDIVVILTDSGGTDTTQTYTTHYTISGGGTTTPDTGTVTMVTAPASGETLTIYRDISKSQDVDYILYNTFPAELHEKALDKLTLIAQDIQGQVDRAAKTGVTSGLTGLTFPDPSASKVIAWNASATALTNVDMSTAVLNINALSTTTPAATDYIPFYSTSLAGNYKALPTAFPVGITNLTEDTSPDAANDYIITYDDSAGVNKKVKIANIPQTGGNAPVGATYVTLSTNATLTSERTLGAGTGVSLTDNGAGNSVDVSVNVNGPSEKVTPVSTDFVLGYDVSGTATKKFKLANLPIPLISTLTADTSPDTTADYVLTYDDSAGANKKVLLDNLFQGNSTVKLTTSTVSSPVSSVDFTNLTSTYRAYIIEIDGALASTSAALHFRTSTDNGATFTSSAAAYSYAQINNTSTNATQILITSGSLNTAEPSAFSGFIQIFAPTDSAKYTRIVSLGAAGTVGYSYSGVRNAAETNNAIRVLPSTGNFTAGKFTLYGVK